MNSSRRPFVVGLTGGIGSGKSAAAQLFADQGVPVIDADMVSRELVRPGSATLQAIIAHFGDEFVQADGSLDRRQLRARIFADEEARQWLEALLHPRIRERIRELVAQAQAPWLILMVPLLLETSAYDFINQVVVVDVSEDTQIARVMQRDHLSRPEAQAILAAQLPRNRRLQLADNVLDNSGTLQDLAAQVATLTHHYEELANDWHQTG